MEWTRQVIRFRTWNMKKIERLLGRWAWVLLLRRPLFSVLGEMYKFDVINTGKPSYEMRCELFTLVAMEPLIQSNLSRRFARVCLAMDTSLQGGGVTYTEITEEEFLSMHQVADHVGRFARRKIWKTAIAHKWDYQGRIDILEGEAVLLGLKWLLQDSGYRGKRVISPWITWHF
jgi:hypothetical protein